MAKEKKKKQVMIDYGKLNRSMYQNMRAVGLLMVIICVIAIYDNGISGHLIYLGMLVLGAACCAYGCYGLSLVRKAEEELEKENRKNGKKNK